MRHGIGSSPAVSTQSSIQVEKQTYSAKSMPHFPKKTNIRVSKSAPQSCAGPAAIFFFNLEVQPADTSFQHLISISKPLRWNSLEHVVTSSLFVVCHLVVPFFRSCIYDRLSVYPFPVQCLDTPGLKGAIGRSKK